MRCVFCGGNVVSKPGAFIYEQDEHLLVIKNVPAEVCTKCGERTYAPETTDEIMRFAKEHFKPVKRINVPVFDYEHKVVARSAAF